MDLFFSESDISEQDLAQIIQPPRQKYNLSDLGPSVQIVNQTTVVRKDFEVTNVRRDTLKCSLYFPRNSQENKLLIIFLHGNSGSRLEANAIMTQVVPLGYHLCAFDSSASGMSGGKYVTMGLNERDDLEAVLQKMKSLCGYQYFILWGRSMGAVTSLLYCLKHQYEFRSLKINGVIGLIIDSAFYSFEQVCQEMASKRVWKVFADRVASVLRRALKKRLDGLDLFEIKLYEVSSLSLPALFAYSDTDTVVGPNHGQALFKQYGGSQKQIIRFNGEHNQKRGMDYFNQIVSFIKNFYPINRYCSSNTQSKPPFHSFHKRSSSQGMIGQKPLRDPNQAEQVEQNMYDFQNKNNINEQQGCNNNSTQRQDVDIQNYQRSNSQGIMASMNQNLFNQNQNFEPFINYQYTQGNHNQQYLLSSNNQSNLYNLNYCQKSFLQQPQYVDHIMFSSRINLSNQQQTFYR